MLIRANTEPTLTLVIEVYSDGSTRITNPHGPENLDQAESSIRDTDMAEEMTKYSKESILQQAATSMLAQANQSNQGVLSLLQ